MSNKQYLLLLRQVQSHGNMHCFPAVCIEQLRVYMKYNMAMLTTNDPSFATKARLSMVTTIFHFQSFILSVKISTCLRDRPFNKD